MDAIWHLWKLLLALYGPPTQLCTLLLLSLGVEPGLAAVSCSPGPRKPLAVEKAVGISCEWVAGYWETLSLLPLDALQPVHPLGGLFVSQHASVLRLSTLGGSEFQVGQEPWLSSPDLHLLGICTWTLADWASEAVHFGQTGGDVSLGFVGGAG